MPAASHLDVVAQYSASGGGTISNGDDMRMSAGGGSLHLERPPDRLTVPNGIAGGEV